MHIFAQELNFVTARTLNSSAEHDEQQIPGDSGRVQETERIGAVEEGGREQYYSRQDLVRPRDRNVQVGGPGRVVWQPRRLFLALPDGADSVAFVGAKVQ